jgi:hypothetical protein
LAILALFAFWSVVVRIAQGYLQRRDIIFVTVICLFAMSVTYYYLFQPSIIEPYIELTQKAIIEKTESASAKERFYWNRKSMLSVSDTYGLGIGLGSSRSSSWIISVIAQLGIIGACVMFYFVYRILIGLRGISTGGQDREIADVASGARAAAIASILASSISGGAVNPGVIFFIALAAIEAARHQSAPQQPVMQGGITRVSVARPQALRQGPDR